MSRRVIGTLVAAALLCASGFAFAQGFMTLGAGSVSGLTVPQPTGKILAVDGVSFILQTDGVSKICRAGGC